MTVAELIEKLRGMPQDAYVRLDVVATCDCEEQSMTVICGNFRVHENHGEVYLSDEA